MKSLTRLIILPLLTAAISLSCDTVAVPTRQGFSTAASKPAPDLVSEGKGKKGAKRAGTTALRPFVAQIHHMPSAETSPKIVQRAIESLTWVEPGSVRISYEDSAAIFRIKKDCKLNEVELRKAVDSTGQGKVISVMRQGNG
jgi:hypothetical protein